MAQNELGEEVPINILEKARLEVSMKCPKYVYKDGEYGDKPPAGSIGRRRASRLGNTEVYRDIKLNPMKDGSPLDHLVLINVQ